MLVFKICFVLKYIYFSFVYRMISTGLQELNSEQDLNIVRTTLRLDRASENEALEMFRKDFNESLRNSWTISLNWWVHMVNQLYNIKQSFKDVILYVNKSLLRIGTTQCMKSYAQTLFLNISRRFCNLSLWIVWPLFNSFS